MTLTALFLAATTLAPLPMTTGATDSVLAIENVTVLTMTDPTPAPGQTVVIREGRIAAVGPASTVTVPAGARRIDGSGRFLMPGLAEMHAHVPPGSPPQQLVEDILFLYLANGITTIRGMLGAPYQLELRDRIAAGEVLGPRFLVGAPSLNGGSAPDPATAERLVREYAAAGYDFLKLHPGLSVATYDALVRTAESEGITTGGHVSTAVGLERTLAARQGTIDHMDGFMEASLPAPLRERVRSDTDTVSMGELFAGIRTGPIPALARATREAGVWVVPTALLYESLFGPITVEEASQWPEMRYAPRSMRQGWAQQKQAVRQQLAGDGLGEADVERFLGFRRAMLRALADQRVGVLLGTDSPQLFSVPGFSLHREIAFMADNGFTPAQILDAGTVNVARYVEDVLGQEGDFGTVEVGQRADLVLLGSNPLEDLASLRDPAGVVVAGRWLSAAEIRDGLAAIAARNPGR